MGVSATERLTFPRDGDCPARSPHAMVFSKNGDDAAEVARQAMGWNQ
jgi:hypothetical protein